MIKDEVHVMGDDVLGKPCGTLQVSAVFIVCFMLCGSSWVCAFEFATMYMFRLYFLGWVPVLVCVCVGV